MEFKDKFSEIANNYLKYRPKYPPTLFSYLASLVTEHQLAWDCATGNGQAAIGLTPYFQRVVASDASAEQIANAIKFDKVAYLVSLAEQISLPDRSVDLITIAQAIHWFNFARFYQEVERVLKPHGVIVAWSYTYPFIKDQPQLSDLIIELHDQLLGNYWLKENRYIDAQYKTIPFPFREITTPDFIISEEWDLAELLGYLNTWSGLRSFVKEQGTAGVEVIFNKLRADWPAEDIKLQITWPLYLRAGQRE